MKRLISTLLLVESVAFEQRCPGATSSSLPPGAAAARWCGDASLAPIFASTWKARSPSRSPGRRIFSGRHEDLIFCSTGSLAFTVRRTRCLHSLRDAPPPHPPGPDLARVLPPASTAHTSRLDSLFASGQHGSFDATGRPPLAGLGSLVARSRRLSAPSRCDGAIERPPARVHVARGDICAARGERSIACALDRTPCMPVCTC